MNTDAGYVCEGCADDDEPECGVKCVTVADLDGLTMGMVFEGLFFICNIRNIQIRFQTKRKPRFLLVFVAVPVFIKKMQPQREHKNTANHWREFAILAAGLPAVML